MEFKNKKPIISKLIEIITPQFKLVPSVTKNISPTITNTDCLLSAFAMFNLKFPSLLKFNDMFRKKENSAEAQNLKNLFKIKKVPSDTYMREILDEISPKSLNNSFLDLHKYTQQKGLYEKYNFLGKNKLIPIDGSEFFNSNEIKCNHCLTKEHKNGVTSYHHQALACVIAHPGMKQVLPFAPEFICNEDGNTKNDCEINSGKRLLERLRKDCPDLEGIILADSLFSNAPFIKMIKDKNFHYIIGAKPGNHVYLYDSLKVYEEKNIIKKISFEKDGFLYEISYINNIWLNSSGDTFVNYIHLEETNKKGRKNIFSWVTDLLIEDNNCFEITIGGRTRWHIENQTFNTLKNQGYQFEHNFGHGNKNLCNVFAMTMFLAFLVDQIQELSCYFFQTSLYSHSARYCFWEKFKSVFSIFIIESWELFYKIANDNFVGIKVPITLNSS